MRPGMTPLGRMERLVMTRVDYTPEHLSPSAKTCGNIHRALSNVFSALRMAAKLRVKLLHLQSNFVAPLFATDIPE